MRIEVINTGTELLLGTTLNTHAAWLGRRLFPLGLRIQRQVCIPDGDEIRATLAEEMKRADVLIVTGGLGPTSDDITREVTAELLGLELAEDADVYEAIRARLARRQREMNDHTRRQAQVPVGARVMPNPNGTAPGLYFPPMEGRAGVERTPHIFLLPGPPRELHPMVDDHVLPVLVAARTGPPPAEMRTLRLLGVGESQVSTTLEEPLQATGIAELGYCVKMGEVQVRVIGTAAQLDACEALIRAEFPTQFLSAVEDDRLEEIVVRLLKETGQTVATCESCTGGLLAHRLTNVAGASEVFEYGLVTYANEAKTDLARVPAELIAAHGAVSEPVARAMAEGVLAVSGADYALALTGIAGPGGGTEEKPVGTVHIALAIRDVGTRHLKECFPHERETFKHLATQTALDMLRLRLVG